MKCHSLRMSHSLRIGLVHMKCKCQALRDRFCNWNRIVGISQLLEICRERMMSKSLRSPHMYCIDYYIRDIPHPTNNNLLHTRYNCSSYSYNFYMVTSTQYMFHYPVSIPQRMTYNSSRHLYNSRRAQGTANKFH